MDELILTLNNLAAGQCAVVPYEMIESIFPPGLGDDHIKDEALKVAKAYSCTIENRPHERAIYFVKEG